MRWAILFLPFLIIAACSGSSTPAPSPTPIVIPLPADTSISSQQAIYNDWLDFNRDFVSREPVLACDPLNWDDLAESAGETRVLFELSLIDACHEAGELPGLLEWSDYYADAIGP